MIDTRRLASLQDTATARWHDPGSSLSDEAGPFEALVLQQHRSNFDLWHEEDRARDPDSPDGAIAQVKHAIDRLNQQRNDLVETIDNELLQAAGEQRSEAPLHSETPGLIIDRLSILSLKLFHTSEQTERPDSSAEHRERNMVRLVVLTEQRQDLAHCLSALWADVLAGRRRFKLYRQMKMYNDPSLNPVLYRSSHGS